MPFELTITDVRYADSEAVITGTITAGAYFGPEEVLVPVVDGPPRRSWITHHSMRGNLAWPLEPVHDALLTVGVHWHEPGPGLFRRDAVRIEKGGRLVGLGVVRLNEEREDLSHLARDPRFWALVLWDHLEPEEDGEPDLREQLLGVPSEASNAFYTQVIDARIREGRWPFVRLPLGGDRYLEFELAGGVEYQNRYWVGVGAQRALAGYHSGHFSLPAFRVDEALRTGAHLPPDAAAAVMILMLSGCYLDEASSAIQAPVAAALQELPGARGAVAAEAARMLAEGLVVDDVRWEADSVRGWVNNGEYSQRNPGSKLSVIGDEGFATIRRFFFEP